jgi:glycosyltransferase involved in cell wall biosynthesis
MRILEVVTTLGAGGAQRLALDLSQALAEQGHRVELVSLFGASDRILENGGDSSNLQVRFLDKKAGLDLTVLLRLARLVYEFKPDIVHTHGDTLSYAVLVLPVAPRAKIVHTVHRLMTPIRQRRFGWYATRHWALRQGIPFVSVSQATASSLQTWAGGGFETPVILNGVPLDRYTPCGHTASPRFRLIHIAGLTQVKDQGLLLDAFRHLLEFCPTARLQIVGDGPLRNQLQRQAVSDGLSETVIFLGARGDIPELLSSADVFVLTSRREAMPITILEAMASGLPVLATKVGGVPEQVADWFTGFVVDRDAVEIARKLYRLTQDACLRHRMGRAARVRAEAKFDIHRTAQLYLNLFERSTQGPRKWAHRRDRE